MYWPPESGNIDPSSAKAKHAQREMTAPSTQTRRNSTGCGRGVAMSFAVRKIDDPIIPLTSSNTESSSPSPRTRVGFASDDFNSDWAAGGGKSGVGSIYPIPSSSGDSSGVPHLRQMTAEQSPQVSGSVTSSAQFGQ